VSRDQFKILHDRIVTPGDGLIIFQGMQDATAESIKSLPTIRTEGSRLWANWNPRRKSDAIDDFLRAKKPDNAIVVQANWRDNPWFPEVLDEERRLDLEIYPERYTHIWEGYYARAFEGAYYAKHLEQARKDDRIGYVPLDPVLPVKAFFDIGGAGHSSDAMAIWICQFVGREIRLLEYIEGCRPAVGILRHRAKNFFSIPTISMGWSARIVKAWSKLDELTRILSRQSLRGRG
jgi:phage terminase large subunit